MPNVSNLSKSVYIILYIEEFILRSLRYTQGYVLSPLLFSLHINSAVKRLKEERCGVKRGDEIVPGLLFADDTCLVASDVSGITGV